MSVTGYHNEQIGKTHNAVAILTTATSAVDLITAGFSNLLILARMTATASGDLVVAVQPYEDDGTTLFAENLPTDQTVASALSGGVDRMMASYKLNGAQKVSVRITNNNALTQTATCVYALMD